MPKKDTFSLGTSPASPKKDLNACFQQVKGTRFLGLVIFLTQSQFPFSSLSQGVDVFKNTCESYRTDFFAHWKSCLSRMDDIYGSKLKVRQRMHHRRCYFWSGGSLYFKPHPPLSSDNQKVQFGSPMGSPEEAFIGSGPQPANNLVQTETFPRCSDFRVCFQV